MFKIRHRSASPRSSARDSAEYSKLSTEDDEMDAVPQLNVYKTEVLEEPKSSFGLQFCFLFSLSGVIFLSIISYLLYHNSIYIQVGHNAKPKRVLANSSFIAVLIYSACCITSAILWYRSARLKSTQRLHYAVD